MKAAIYSNAKSRLLSNHLAGRLDEWVGWLLCVFRLGGRIYIILRIFIIYRNNSRLPPLLKMTLIRGLGMTE